MPQAQADRLRHDAEGEPRRLLVGRITLSEAYEQVRAKEQKASAQATDAIG